MRSWFVLCASMCVCWSSCVVEVNGAAAQSACSQMNAAFCERLAECERSVNEQACIDADDALGGPCANASVVSMEADAATCAQAIGDMECARIEARTSPDFDLDCLNEIQFDE